MSVFLVLRASIYNGTRLDIIADGFELLRLLDVCDVDWGVDELVDLVLVCLHLK